MDEPALLKVTNFSERSLSHLQRLRRRPPAMNNEESSKLVTSDKTMTKVAQLIFLLCRLINHCSDN